MFKLQAQTVLESETTTLDELYKQYERRILWKLDQIEERKHNEVCQKTPRRKIGLSEWCQCRTRQEEIHEWEDWAMDNFGKMPEEISWEIPENVYAKVRI